MQRSFKDSARSGMVPKQVNTGNQSCCANISVPNAYFNNTEDDLCLHAGVNLQVATLLVTLSC